MPTAVPETLVATLAAMVQDLGQKASGLPATFQQVLDEAGEVTELPGRLLEQLKQAVDPPDYPSLLVFALLQLATLDSHLKVGVSKPAADWARAVTLSYVADGANRESATLALALTGDGVHGVAVSTADNLHLGFTAGRLTLSVDAGGVGEWRVPFAGGLVTPSAGATVTVTARYGPLRTAAPGPIDVVVGAAQISVTLSTGAPMWRVSAGLGGPGEPGLEAKVDIGSMLGALGSIVNIAALDEAYSPAVTVTAGGAPVFELGHSGNG